jgi:hypothetical protein
LVTLLLRGVTPKGSGPGYGLVCKVLEDLRPVRDGTEKEETDLLLCERGGQSLLYRFEHEDGELAACVY